MMKYAIMASSVLVSVPIFAQDAPSSRNDVPQEQGAPAAGAGQEAPSASQNATAPAASRAEQISQVIATEFPSYDKDKSGSLSKVEFSSWLVALRQASDASFKAGTPEADTWVGQAFTFADTDKNQSVTQTELTTFLSQGVQ